MISPSKFIINTDSKVLYCGILCKLSIMNIITMNNMAPLIRKSSIIALSWIKCIFHVFSQFCNASRSICNLMQSSLVSISLYSKTLSALSRILLETHSGTSFIKHKNNKGPRTVP